MLMRRHAAALLLPFVVFLILTIVPYARPDKFPCTAPTVDVLHITAYCGDCHVIPGPVAATITDKAPPLYTDTWFHVDEIRRSAHSTAFQTHARKALVVFHVPAYGMRKTFA